MRKISHSCFRLLVLTGACFHLVADAAGQMRSRWSALRIEMGTGYDSNLFRIANQSDSNRVEAPLGTIEGRASWWLYWQRGIQTNLAATGGYAYYPSNTFANEWQWSAKTKTNFALKRRPSAFFPATNLEIALGAMQIDQIYTNRELGGEAYSDVNDDGLAQIQLGDLYDRKSYFLGGSLEFEFGKRSSLSLGYTRETKDYANLGDPVTQNIYSLDNTENSVAASFDIKPALPVRIKLGYAGQDRQYKYRLARSLDGTEIPNQYRQYWTNSYDLSVSWNLKRWTAKIGTGLEQRQDRYQGYYNSLQKQFGGNVTFALSSYAQFKMGLERTWKDYERLVLAGNILSNGYLTLEAGVSLSLLRGLVLQTSFIHDRESSTFPTFNYRRNIGMAVIKYSLD